MRDQLRSRANFVIPFLIVGAVVFLDRVLKSFFSNTLSLGESIPVLRNIFHITLIHNTGIAFGLFKNQGIVFIIVPIIAIVLIAFNIYYYHNSREVSFFYIVGFSLILAGATGNLIDRVLFGYVVDFIDFRIWPVFNIADSAITIGTTIILIKCIPSFAK